VPSPQINWTVFTWRPVPYKTSGMMMSFYHAEQALNVNYQTGFSLKLLKIEATNNTKGVKKIVI
jgi:hypothetical protein